MQTGEQSSRGHTVSRWTPCRRWSLDGVRSLAGIRPRPHDVGGGSGPTLLLADMGAEVLKVERPRGA